MSKVYDIGFEDIGIRKSEFVALNSFPYFTLQKQFRFIGIFWGYQTGFG